MDGGRKRFEKLFLNNQPGITSWCNITFTEQLMLPVSVWLSSLKRALALSKKANGK
ncbi:hypothetical protein TB147_03910 [Klebsiella aerogenes]|uniref:hypothetical protein n=1 Tax=Klebsiella aerogenes TaxID=548 RepID=UPI002E32CFB3|nr:hypothetical protein [Klebsiella aerogenes]MED7790463.1 hypothetical protein [Klebsiella aerogenes]